MLRSLSIPALLSSLAILLPGCGGKGADRDGEPARGYARLAECDTMNWLGLPDSLSCPKSGGLCQISGLGKVGTNVCSVGKSAYVYSVISGVSFASETRATLNSSGTLTGPATGLLIFDDLQGKNELVVKVEYKEALQDPEPSVYAKTYRFLGVE